jgi:Nucleotidyltransferase
LIGRLHPHAITAERPDEGDDGELVEWLAAIVRGAPSLMRVLLTIRALELPDWLIMSGAVHQRVLNALTEQAPDYLVRDYDLGYFDASDISYEAEDVVIRRVTAAFDEPLRSVVEVRNQARVHVWFELRADGVDLTALLLPVPGAGSGKHRPQPSPPLLQQGGASGPDAHPGSGRNVRVINLNASENPGLSCRGTRSSNPSPSSGESANFRSLARCRDRGEIVTARQPLLKF